jgi:hypothetical protein
VSEEAGSDFDNDDERPTYDKREGIEFALQGAALESDSDDGEFSLKKKGGDIEDIGFGAVKPWIGQVAEPYEHNPINKNKPEQSLALEYVYGYSTRSRQNVYFNNQSEIVYNAAALGVILDP